MEFVRTAELEPKVLEQFFEDKWEVFKEKKVLHKFGFLVDYEEEYKAYFALSPVEENGFWLKSLYIKEGVPATFPLAIIESSIALAKENGAKALYVYSHQTSLNSLLSLLQFKQQNQIPFSTDEQLDEGTWWKYGI